MTEAAILELFVPGKPEPKGSTRSFVVTPKGGKPRAVTTSDNPEVGSWQGRIAELAKAAMFGRPAFRGPVQVTVRFAIARPRSHYTATGRLSSRAPLWHTSKPDLDKLERAVLDGLRGKRGAEPVVLADDAIVVAIRSRKAWCDPGHEGAAIIATALEEGLAPSLGGV